MNEAMFYSRIIVPCKMIRTSLKVNCMNIYVGNLSFRAKEQDLSDLFSTYGEVVSARIVKDKFTHRSRGFAFVEMSNDNAAREAIQAFHEKEFMERALFVNEAKPREDKPREGNAE